MTNFDRVAGTYDQTRQLPPQEVERVADAVIAATRATRDTRFLELGIGTGRVALPFIERGYRYTGVDISEKMMAQLRSKVGEERDNLTLLQTDAMDLPFQDASFDVLISVHVFHLLEDWRKALAEARRVLDPNGYFVLGYDGGLPGDPGREIREQWYAFVAESGIEPVRRDETWQAVEAELTQQGAFTAVYRAAHWEAELRPIDLLNGQRARVFSQSWDVPDGILAQVHERMLTWARERYGFLETPIASPREFILSVSRFGE